MPPSWTCEWVTYAISLQHTLHFCTRESIVAIIIGLLEHFYIISTSSSNKCISGISSPRFRHFSRLTIHKKQDTSSATTVEDHGITPFLQQWDGSPILTPAFCNAGLPKKKCSGTHLCTKHIPILSNMLHLLTFLPSSNIAQQRLLIVLVPCTKFKDKLFFQELGCHLFPLTDQTRSYTSHKTQMMTTLPLDQAIKAVEAVQLGAISCQFDNNAQKRPEKWLRSTER